MSVERRLSQVLGGWAAASVVAGAVLARQPSTRTFGRQTLLWGLIDGAIAGWGALGQRRGKVTPPGRLRRVLLVNAGLDVGYLAAGALLVRRTRWRGDGAAVLVQGGFLLVLDALAARALRPAA